MSLVIGKYTIKKDDEQNLSLYVKKISSSGKNKGEIIESHRGYYGYLYMALNKIVNLELVEGLSSSTEAITARELHESIKATYDLIEDAYKTREV